MKILIVGTGAVGGYYGAKLTLAGEKVTFLARGDAFKVLKKKNLVVKSYQGKIQTPIRVISNLRNLPLQDLILICVKSYDTQAILTQIKPVVGKKTILLSLQNGVENEALMIKAFGKNKVIGGLCYIGAEMIRPGVILHSARGQISIGEMNGQVTQRIKHIVALFQKAKIDVRLSSNIQRDLWTKLCWNAAFNQICTVARADVGSVLESPSLSLLLKRAMKEVAAIAKPHGIIITKKEINTSLRLSRQDLPAVRPSMLQDFERGKRTEYETFSGFLVREGQRLKIPVPLNTILYAFLDFLTLRQARNIPFWEVLNISHTHG